MERHQTTQSEARARFKTLLRLRNVAIAFLVLFFLGTWALLFWYFVGDIHGEFDRTVACINPYRYSRWVTSHDRNKMAVLVRDYFFDLNFRLFIIETSIPEIPTDINKAIWSSRDYEPTTHRNWHEDVEWSRDSTVVAVTIEGEYVFAYDFALGRELEDAESIRELLEAHDIPVSVPSD